MTRRSVEEGKPPYAELSEREQVQYDVAEIRSCIRQKNTEKAVELIADVLERVHGAVPDAAADTSPE